MASLRVALKLSLAESGGAPTVSNSKDSTIPNIVNDPPIVSRKRKHSFEKDSSTNATSKKKSKSKSGKEGHEDDESLSIVKSSRSNTPTQNIENDLGSVIENEDSMISIQEFSKEIQSEQDKSDTAGIAKKEEPEENEKLNTRADTPEGSVKETEEAHGNSKPLDKEDVIADSQDSVMMDSEKDSKLAQSEIAESESNANQLETQVSMDSMNVDQEVLRENEQDLENEQAPHDGKKSDKRKKKRTPAILRALEIANLGSESSIGDIDEGNNADHEGGDNQPRYQSSRAAAKVAKSKLNVSKVSKQQEQTQSLKTVEEPNRGANKGQQQRRGASSTQEATPQVVLEWVQCDKCGKWRSFDKAKIDEDSLPEEWYCSLNTWSEYNSCDIEEESAAAEEEANNGVIEEEKNTKSESDDARNIKEENNTVITNTPAKSTRNPSQRSAMKERSARKERMNNTNNDEDAVGETVEKDDNDEKDNIGTIISTRRRSSANTASTAHTSSHSNTQRTAKSSRNSNQTNESVITSQASNAVVNPVNWVMCNKCKKWRKVPETIDVDSLPEKWYCYMNSWSVLYSRCTTKEEEDNGVAEGSSIHTSNAGKSGGSRGLAGRGGSQRNNTANTNTAKDSNGIKKTSWVRCDRKTCLKWRKVPAHINVDDLGEKWFCEYNTWDPDYSTCDAAQESASEDESSQAAAVRQRYQIQSNSKGSNALSYRKIIFGNDGKIRACFSEKNKMGFGIFSCLQPNRSLDNDDPNEPAKRISYWWSSTYDETPRANTSQATDSRSSKKTSVESSEVQSKPIPSEVDPVLSRVNTFGQQLTLIDTVRRIHGWAPAPALLPEQLVVRGDDGSQPIVHPKQRLKAQKILAETSIFHRIKIEMVTVRSCCFSCTANISAQKQLDELQALYEELEKVDESSPRDPLIATVIKSGATNATTTSEEEEKSRDHVQTNRNTLFSSASRRTEVTVATKFSKEMIHFSLVQLQNTILNSKFVDPEVEACRQVLATDIMMKNSVIQAIHGENHTLNGTFSTCCDRLKVILHRLEESHEIEVALNSNGQVVLTMLPSLETLRSRIAAKKEKFNKIVNQSSFGDKWAEGGYPLKLRKFFVEKRV